MERLVDPLETFNEWTERLWRTDESEALDAVDRILRTPSAFHGAGRSYPSMLMYLRDSTRFAVWLQITHRGLTALTGFGEPTDRRGGVARYLRYCEEASTFARRHDLAPQELDAVLSTAARAAAEQQSTEAEVVDLLAEVVVEPFGGVQVGHRPAYSIEQVQAATHVDSVQLEEWLELLRGRKRQALLYGPPGTGKSFLARHLAEHLAGEDGEWQMVQFHPSYGYEHFVEGLHPVADAGGGVGYEVRKGVFHSFCQRAADSDGTFVFVVDEINRAEMSVVFGELMMLLEYRGVALTLPYSHRSFAVPDNLVFLGTMNTADRSLALVDFALRRRFHHFSVYPERRVLAAFFEARNLEATTALELFDLVQESMDNRDYAPGHAYWMIDDPSPAELLKVWRYQLQPYLSEYWFDNPTRLGELDRAVVDLLAAET